MDKSGILEKIKQFLCKENNLTLVIAGVAAVALLITIFTSSLAPAAQEADQDESKPASLASDSLEVRLQSILSQIENAGDVQVFVAYATGPEIVPAMSVDTQKNTSDGGSSGTETHTESTTENREPVVIQGKNGTEPMVLTQKEPEVLGVLVVAEGASALEVRLRLAAAVQVALQLPANRIEVLPMDTSNYKEGTP